MTSWWTEAMGDPTRLRPSRPAGPGSPLGTGSQGVTFHTLRHGAATLMLAAGVPDPVAIWVMGHADARILRRYQEVVPQLLKDVATRMDGLLGQG
jgi:integrase